VIARLVTAFASHDLEAILACYQHDAFLDTTGLPGGGHAYGHGAIRSAYSEIFSILPELKASVLAERTRGRFTLRQVSYEGRHPASEAPLTLTASELLEVDDGLIASARLYLDAAEAEREFDRLSAGGTASPRRP